MLTKLKVKWEEVFFWSVFVLLAFRLFNFVNTYAVDLFFNDQWGYLTTSLYPNDLITGFFTRLGPHRIGLAYPFFKSTLVIFDYNNVYMAHLVVVLAVINALLFTWLKIKRIGPLRVTDIYIPLIFFTLTQNGIFLNNPNISLHQLVFFFLLLLITFFTGTMKPWKFVSLMVLAPIITFTGNGFFVSIIVVAFSILMIIKDQKRLRFWWSGLGMASLISLIAYLATANYQAMDCTDVPHESFWYHLNFFKGMVLSGLVIRYQETAISWLVFIGIIGLGSVVIFRLLKNKGGSSELAPAVFVGYTLLFIAATMLGRWCYGTAIINSSRYVPHLTLGFAVFGLFGFNKRKWLGLGYGLFLTLSFIYAEYNFHKWHLKRVVEHTEKMNEWKECYLQTRSVEDCTKQLNFKPYPHDPKKKNLQQKLERLEELNPSFKR